MTDEYSAALQQAQKDMVTSAQPTPKPEQGNSEAQNMTEAIWAFDVRNNRIYWSEQIFDMLGIPKQELPLTMESVMNLIHPEDRQAFEKVIQTSLNTKDPFEATLRMRYGSGPYLTVQFGGKVFMDDGGKPNRISGRLAQITTLQQTQNALEKANKDLVDQSDQHAVNLENINLVHSQEIAEQKEIEIELKKSLKREKLTKHLVQLMNRSFNPDIILEMIVRELGTFFDADRCLVILYKNEIEDVEGLRAFAQYCRSEATRPILEEEIPWDEWKELPKKQSTSSSSNKPNLGDEQVQSAFSTEIKYRNIAFGRLVLQQCSHPRIWTELEIDFLKILATHIGAALYQVKLYQWQKQARQEAEEANQQKSKVLSFVSHDFKNPLDSMKRFTDLLENDKSDILSENQRELIGYIAEGVYQLRNMVRDILDKARLEEGKIYPIPQWIEINSFLDDLKPMFNSMASQRNIDVRIELQPEINAIKADPTHLRQILINLVSNAVKYNRVGSKAYLRLYKSEDGQSAIIEVQDSGPGIPPEKIPQLFTEYFRGDLSQSNLVEGTGLGLAFIKKLIELHGGSISVESEVGGGSTFKVTLPLSVNHSENV